MPDFDVAATYATTINATPAQVYTAILETDFGSHPIVALLMGIRSIPAFLASPRATLRRLRTAKATGGQQLKTMLSDDFVLLEETPSSEMVLGLTGRFWTPSGGLIRSDPAIFRQMPPTGLARAAWNFRVAPMDNGQTRLSTETRVRCGDEKTTRQFKRYWTLVAPGSGLIRWVILRQVRRKAERVR